MGKVFYNNWFAKLILFQGYGTIMFLGMILTKAKEGRLSEKTINHETIHQYQYCECLLIVLFKNSGINSEYNCLHPLVICPA